MEFDAIVLAGGQALRLSGADKGAVEVGDAILLRHALAAVSGASTITIVGPPSNADLVDEQPSLTFVTEDPPRGGPAAAVAAGLAGTSQELVVVLACDMPFVRAKTIDRLLEAAETSADGAMLVDQSRRKQYLAAAYRAPALARALGTLQPIANAPLHRAVSLLTVAEVQADPDEAFDVDTWSDVDRSRRLWEES